MSPELEKLIEKAKARGPMTAEERAEQRRSWVRGELMLKHPGMTLEEADRRVRQAEKELYRGWTQPRRASYRRDTLGISPADEGHPSCW